MIDPTKPIINNVLRMQLQKSINERLDKLIFVELDGATFDSGIGTHKNNTIYVVTRSDHIELYKGDIRIYFNSETIYCSIIVESINPV